MIIAMPTVPHSGTHFLRIRVLKGREQIDINGTLKDRFQMIGPKDELEEGRDTIYTAHYNQEFMGLWADIVGEYPTVITLRHPARTTESYRRRAVIGSNPQGVNCNHWNNLLYLSEYFTDDVLFLHLDQPTIRIKQARAIQKRFKIPSGVDWTVGTDINCKAGTHDWEPPADYDVPQEHINFYQETQHAH